MLSTMPAITSQLGVFGFYIISFAVAFLILSMFVRFLRGLILIVTILACFYYYGLATPTIKKEMDNRTSQIVKIITKNIKK